MSERPQPWFSAAALARVVPGQRWPGQDSSITIVGQGKIHLVGSNLETEQQGNGPSLEGVRQYHGAMAVWQ